MSSFISQTLTEIEVVTGCTFACICHTVFRMFSCLQINWQPFYLRQLLKPLDWLIEIYLQTEGQGTHYKMVSLQPMPGFPLCSMGAKVNSHNLLSAVSFLVHPLDLATKWLCFTKKWVSAFYPMGQTIMKFSKLIPWTN